MAERDRFEVDLTAALLVYLEGAPTQVRPLELARHFAAAHPHRRAGIGHWPLVAVPRIAWILLLAALLTALLAGTLFVGSQLQRRVPAIVPPVVPAFVCPPGSTPDAPGPANQARPPDGGPMAFDRAAGKIVMLASAGTWTFDVCSNTWTQMQSGSGPDTGLALVYDPRADLTINVDYPEDPVASPPHAWAYSLADNTWRRKGPAPGYVVRLWYDEASARVTAWTARADSDPGTIWAYDVAADTWTTVGTLEVLGGFPWGNPGDDLLAYDASLDRVVATVVGGSETRLFDMRTGSLAVARAAAPWAGQCGWFSTRYCYGRVAGADIAYDERAQRTVVLIGGYMFSYDAAADRWETLYGPGAADTSDAVASASAAAGALALYSSDMVSDPVNGRLVVLGDVDAVLAFDATTRGWTVLLEPSKVQPRPTP
jgi:phage baseplate assembly protein gpV